MLPVADFRRCPAVFDGLAQFSELGRSLGGVALKEDEIARLLSTVRVSFRATCAVLLLIVIHTRPALSGVPEGTWLLANRVAVQVFECSGELCGRIVWLLRPRTPAGQPDLDHVNPDPSLRQRHLCARTLPLRPRVRAPARETAPEIKSRGRPTRSNGGRSTG